MSDLKIHVFGARVDTENMHFDENELDAVWSIYAGIVICDTVLYLED